MAFDPDAYLKAKTAFDPDAYLAAKVAAPKMGPAEAVGHGTLDTVPFGQKLMAGGRALMDVAGDVDLPGIARGIVSGDVGAGDVGADLTDALGQRYQGRLERERADLARAEKEQKWATRGGKALGAGLSMALAPAKAAQAAGMFARTAAAAGNAGLYGFAHSAGNADDPANFLPDALTEGGVSAALGGGLSLAGETLVAPAARYLGAKAKDLAGWLKVNSLHPTPTLAESMEALPGGKAAVGRELLDRGIGGLTKGGTAKQAAAAMDEAGQAVTALAKTYDAAGGASVDVLPALAQARAQANKLMVEPTTRAAGERLDALVAEYESLYRPAPVGPQPPPTTAAKALLLKRALGKAAYGAKQQLNKSGDPVAGDFGAGVAGMERSVNNTLDQTLGPAFEQANLTYRRLLGASNAADRQAGRASANHLLSLKDLVAGDVAAHEAGLAGSLKAALLHNLMGRYGAQAGAQGAHLMGRALEAAPGVAPSALTQVAGGAAREPIQEMSVGRMRLLLAALRQKQEQEQLAQSLGGQP